MEIASAPTTPESSGSPHFLRRSFTAPIRSTGFARATEPPRQTGGQTVETLYTHNAGRIVSFEAYSSVIRRHSSLGYGRLDQQDEPVGTLPWASSTERTIAAGNSLFFISQCTRMIASDRRRLSRPFTNLQSAGLRSVSTFRHNHPTYTGKVAMLVR